LSYGKDQKGVHLSPPKRGNVAPGLDACWPEKGGLLDWEVWGGGERTEKKTFTTGWRKKGKMEGAGRSKAD